MNRIKVAIIIVGTVVGMAILAATTTTIVNCNQVASVNSSPVPNGDMRCAKMDWLKLGWIEYQKQAGDGGVTLETVHVTRCGRARAYVWLDGHFVGTLTWSMWSQIHQDGTGNQSEEAENLLRNIRKN